jgi:mannitol-1-phosphate 5-dehydrogenase
MKVAVHFGAGNIGRGFIGLKLFESGFHISFVDVNPSVINALKEKKGYDVEYLDDQARRFRVDQCTGLHSVDDADDIQKRLLEAELITTAVGPNILPLIAKTLVPMIKERCAQKIERTLNIIACENMMGGSSRIEALVLEALSDDEMNYVSTHIGFPNAAVDRIVPQQSHSDPLFVQVEPFYEWVIDTNQLKGVLVLNGVHFTDQLEAYIERKLFTVNTGHASCAYAAYRKHIKTIVEAMHDEEIALLVESVMHETGAYLIKVHGFDPTNQAEYIAKTLERFRNPNIIDDVPRVARTPIRKLSHQERFIRPLLACYQNALPYQMLLRALVNVLYFDSTDDEEAIQLQKSIHTKGIRLTLQDVTGLTDNHPLVKEIEDLYSTKG